MPITFVQPFFHILASDIAFIVGEDKPREVIATTIVSFALSSLLTGMIGHPSHVPLRSPLSG